MTMTRIQAKYSGLSRQLGVSGLIVLASALLLTWLFVQAERVLPQEHFDYSRTLRDLREADAETNGEVLANRLELTHNYDMLTATMAQLQQAGVAAAELPSFLPNEARTQVAAEVRALQGLVQQKARQVEVFKRQSAVLRNSLSYFTATADEVLGRLKPTAARSNLERYVRLLQAFARDPRDPGSERRQEIAQARSMLDSADRDIGNLLLHGDTIVRYLPEVNDMTRRIRELGTEHQMAALNYRYALGYEQAQQVAGQYRRAMYVLALMLTAYLAYLFLRLERARRSLTRAHEEVSERYMAQLRAEESLRLHATAFANSHDGIVLADANGNVLDVNPAFTRITGYERDEVIGRNPRVIKSGRHDRDFYAAMWKSILGQGSWQGEIWNRNKFGEIYPELLSISAVRNPTGELTNFVAVFADISRLKEQETQLTRMAYYDALTELPNRVLLADRLQQAISVAKRSGNLLAVCYLDLDGFKPVNDTYGHEAGDRLLIEMAGRLKALIRGGDTVARLGGDEFVLLFGLNDIAECEQALQRLLDAIGMPVSLAEAQVKVSASVGVTLYPTDKADPDTLLRHADQAMYQAKQTGKNRYHIFDYEQDFQVRAHHDRIGRLEEALRNDEFVLYYQPKVDMRRGEVIGMEALIRWQHPVRGLLVPGEFLPLIEGHDLIVDMGRWVIECALRQMESWHALGLKLPVSVNVAGRHLLDAGFVNHLQASLERYPVGKNLLELEILETSALEDMNRVSRIIEKCSQLGVAFALDDFGTGYSSLSYLKRLPAAVIKVDQSFVRELDSDPNNLVIIQGVLGLASAFQRRVIAEGVETIEQGRVLLELECDCAQGYGIARPMQAELVPSWVRAWSPDPRWVEISGLRWEEADRPMLVAQVEHQSWVNQLISAVQEDFPLGARFLAKHTECNFGGWYHGRGAAQYSHLPDYVAIDTPHRRVHEIARSIDACWRDGRRDEARGMLVELKEQRDLVLAALNRLELAVARTRSRG